MLFFLLFLSFSTLVFSFFILFLLSRWPFLNFSFSFFTPNSYLYSYAFIIFLFWKSFFLFGHFFFLFFFFFSQCSFFKLFPLFFFITNSYFSTFLQLLQFSLFFLSCFFFLSCLKKKRKKTKKKTSVPLLNSFEPMAVVTTCFYFSPGTSQITWLVTSRIKNIVIPSFKLFI